MITQSVQSQTCPNCGHCPHCGRSNPQFAPYYPWPYYSQPIWYSQPTITSIGTYGAFGAATTVTMGPWSTGTTTNT